jgi:predicted nucleic acid-binding protein
MPNGQDDIRIGAIEACSRLITGNVKHFSRFEDLTVENWIR